MATNEIAAAVQCGQADVLKLWKEVRRFAIKQGLRWLRALDGKGGATLDDLEQCAFLAMLDALESWNIDSGSFIGWYAYQLRTAYQMAMGVRTKRDKQDPINSALPLDEPLTDREGDSFTIADVTPDLDAEAAFDLADIRFAVWNALAAIPENERQAIIAEFWYGAKPDVKLRRSAFKHLRHPSISKNLRAFL